MKYLMATLMLVFSASVFAADNTLIWDDVDGEDGFTVYAVPQACSPATQDMTFSPLGNVGPNVNSFVHSTGADNGFNWCYKVTAYNANGESGLSNQAGKVPATPGFLNVK